MSDLAAVGAIAPEILGDLPPLPQAVRAQPPGGTADPANAFAGLFAQGLAQVNESLLAGQADMQRLATGDVQNLHQLMIRIEESRVSFQLMMQVRSRLLEAYQDVMRMQI